MITHFSLLVSVILSCTMHRQKGQYGDPSASLKDFRAPGMAKAGFDDVFPLYKEHFLPQ